MSIKAVFSTFCTTTTEKTGEDLMDQMGFSKFAKDLKLIEKNFTKQDVDTIFTKSKTDPTARTIGCEEFESKVIPQIALKKGMAPPELVKQIISMAASVLSSNSNYQSRTMNSSLFESKLSSDDSVLEMLSRESLALITNTFKSYCNTCDLKGCNSEKMDLPVFLKFCKDCKFINFKSSSIGIELIFTKAKVQGERKLNFSNFLKAIFLIAEKYREKGPDVAFELVIDQIKKSQTTNIINTKTLNIYEKLTDSTLYTGAHKNRFDEKGKGLGAEGRVQNTFGVSDLSQITRGNKP